MDASFHHKAARYNVETHRVRWCALVSPPATVATSTACVPGNHFVEAHTTSRLVATIPGTFVSNTHAWLMTRTCCVVQVHSELPPCKVHSVRCFTVASAQRYVLLHYSTIPYRMPYEVLRIYQVPGISI